MDIDIKQESLEFSINCFGDRYIKQINPSQFLFQSSDDVFNNKFGSKLQKEYHFYIIAGTDSGLLIEHLIKQSPAKGSHYLFIEEENIISKIQQKKELSSLKISEQQQFHLCTLETWQEKIKELDLRQYAFLGAFSFELSLSILSPTYKNYLLFRPEVEKSYQDLHRTFSSHLSNKTFITNQIKNLVDNHISASILKDVGDNKVAILLAGGPSLDDVLDWVQKHKDKLIIIAVSRISKRLHQVGLVPDIIATVDPDPLSYEVSKEMFYFQDKSLLLYQYHTEPSIVNKWAGRKCYMGKAFPWPVKNAPKTINAPGPTVTHAALSVLIDMNFKTIILAGVDLCFSQTGISHAQGSTEYDAGPMLNRATVLVQTNNNNQAESPIDYYQGIHALTKLAHKAKENGIKLINTAPFAVKIDNIDYESITELLNEKDEVINKKLLLSTLASQSNKQRLDNYQQNLKELQHANYQLEQIKKMSFQALEFNSLLFGKNGIDGDFKYKIKLDKLEKKLHKKTKDFSILIQSFAITEFLKFLTLKDDKDESDHDLRKRANIYYQSFIDGSKELSILIKNTINELNLRINESNSDLSSIKVMLDDWLLDNNIGQSIRWHKNHSSQYQQLTNEEKLLLQQLEDKFWQQINTTKEKVITEEEESLFWQQACYKVELAFNIKDLAALKRLKKSLLYYPESNHKAQALLKITSADILSINNNLQGAIELWSQVSNAQDFKDVKIIALKRLITHSGTKSLNSYLNQLSKLDDNYNNIYARYLCIDKQYSKAVPHLLQALKRQPHNKQLLKNLKQGYQQSNQTELMQLIDLQLNRLEEVS